MSERHDHAGGDGLSAAELDNQIASELPDREAMSLVPPDLLGPIQLPPPDDLLTELLGHPDMPAEAQTLDFGGIVTGTLSPDGSPLDALPPELVPDTIEVSEQETIGG